MGMLQKLTLNSYFSIGGGSEITISKLWKDSKDGRSALLALGRQLRNTQHVDARKFRRSSRQERELRCKFGACQRGDPCLALESVSGCRQASGAKESKEFWGH